MKQTFIRLFILLTLTHVCVLAQQSGEAQMQRLAEAGERALAEQRYEAAAEAFEKLKKIAPGIAEIHARLGLIYFQQQDFEKAVTALRQAIKLKPALPNLDVLLAMSLSELGRFEEALPGLVKGFKNLSDPVLRRSSGLQLQRAYTGLQQDDKAVDVALEMTRAFPEDPEVLYHAGRLFGNYAYLSTVKLKRVAPDSLWLHLAAGEAFESQGQYDAAIREYREVVSVNPNRPGIHFRIGRVLLARAQQSTTDTVSEPEALKEFESELKIDQMNSNAAYEAAEIHRKSARFEEARKMFSLALKYYPNFEDALLGLGRTLVTLGKAEEALPHLQKALSIDAGNEVSWYQLSLVYKSLGKAEDQAKALAEFQRLRNQKTQSEQENAGFSRGDVTRQKLDNVPPNQN